LLRGARHGGRPRRRVGRHRGERPARPGTQPTAGRTGRCFLGRCGLESYPPPLAPLSGLWGSRGLRPLHLTAPWAAWRTPCRCASWRLTTSPAFSTPSSNSCASTPTANASPAVATAWRPSRQRARIRPDGFVLALRMPRQDGLAVLRAWRPAPGGARRGAASAGVASPGARWAPGVGRRALGRPSRRPPGAGVYAAPQEGLQARTDLWTPRAQEMVRLVARGWHHQRGRRPWPSGKARCRSPCTTAPQNCDATSAWP